VRPAGTGEGARVKVTGGHLGWADVIVVMEKRHKERLAQNEKVAGQCLGYERKHDDRYRRLEYRLQSGFCGDHKSST